MEKQANTNGVDFNTPFLVTYRTTHKKIDKAL